MQRARRLLPTPGRTEGRRLAWIQRSHRRGPRRGEPGDRSPGLRCAMEPMTTEDADEWLAAMCADIAAESLTAGLRERPELADWFVTFESQAEGSE